jgi:hypothetical protein
VPNVKAEESMDALQADLLRFLASPTISDGIGSLYSWVNKEHPGFIYPEAMGLHLRLFSVLAARTRDEALRARTDEVAAALARITPPSGGVGMAGEEFVFDTCMVIGGLHAYRTKLGGTVDEALLARVSEFVRTCMEKRQVVVDGGGREPEPVIHWSRMFGAHMLKTVIALDALRIITGEGRYAELIGEVAEQVIRTCRKDGAFRVGPGQTTVYTHAHCYALEGLLYLRKAGLRDETGMLTDGAERLAGWQNEDGSMFNWQEDPSRDSSRARVGDATSQTVRIWLAVDREKYAGRIERALGFLMSLKSPSCGLRYATGSEDINIITSVFAAQAVDWRINGAQPEWLA